MIVKNFQVRHVTRQDIQYFIEQNHYSGNINGCITDFCFALYHEDTMIGAAFFGRLAMANQWKRFSQNRHDVIELRRLCCIDNTPKNTESFFIGKMLKWLKKNTSFKIVVSYADSEYGHEGTIYKASNFEYLGKQKGAKIIIHNGKRYHDKAIRAKHAGKLKPFAEKLRAALASGEAVFKDTAGKHTYIYKLDRKHTIP